MEEEDPGQRRKRMEEGDGGEDDIDEVSENQKEAEEGEVSGNCRMGSKEASPTNRRGGKARGGEVEDEVHFIDRCVALKGEREDVEEDRGGDELPVRSSASQGDDRGGTG